MCGCRKTSARRDVGIRSIEPAPRAGDILERPHVHRDTRVQSAASVAGLVRLAANTRLRVDFGCQLPICPKGVGLFGAMPRALLTRRLRIPATNVVVEHRPCETSPAMNI
jgi:hypothetical protein